MAISPFELSGAFTRTQDYTVFKHNDDVKPTVNQAVFQNAMDKQVEKQLNRVRQSDETDTYQRKQDAKEKGKNEYQGDGGSRRPRGQQDGEDGKVVRKERARFDYSV